MDSKLYRTLNAESGIADEISGVKLTELLPSSLIEVETMDSLYTIAVIDPVEGWVAVRGDGQYFTEPRKCVLSGSTFGGSAIKLRFIGIGMYMEFATGGGQAITTSPIRTIKVALDEAGANQLVQLAMAVN